MLPPWALHCIPHDGKTRPVPGYCPHCWHGETLEQLRLIRKGMPMPWSDTVITSSPGRGLTRRVTCPPWGEYLMALESRLPDDVADQDLVNEVCVRIPWQIHRHLNAAEGFRHGAAQLVDQAFAEHGDLRGLGLELQAACVRATDDQHVFQHVGHALDRIVNL